MAEAGKVARKLFKAVSEGEFEKAMKLLSDDVILHIPGNNQASGTFKGKAEYGQAVGKMEELAQGTLKRELHDVTSSDTHAVVLVRVSAQRDGKSYAWNAAVVLDVRDGKGVEQWLLNDSPQVLDELFR